MKIPNKSRHPGDVSNMFNVSNFYILPVLIFILTILFKN